MINRTTSATNPIAASCSVVAGPWPARDTAVDGGPRARHHTNLPSPAPLIDQIRHQSRPSCLMVCAEALASVRIEVLVEQHEVLPVRVMRKKFGLAAAARTV